MRKTLALSVTSLLLAAGAALAYDDCSCTCEGNGQQQMRRADAGSTRDGYFLRNGKVMVFRNGTATELTQDASFDNGMRLQADGTILYADGNRTSLRDSQMLAMDGQFFDRERVNAGFRDTQIQGGRDGYFVGRNGKVMSFREGKIQEITSDITFDNGARLSVDGTFTMKDGTRSRLDNSQWMSFSGEMSNKAQIDNRNARDVSNQNNANANVKDANRTQSQRNDVNVDAKTNTNVNDVNRNQAEKHENKVESKTNTNIDANRNQNERHDTNVESKTNTNVDAHKTNVDAKTNIDANKTNVDAKTNIDANKTNVESKTNIDTNKTNVDAKTNIDANKTNVDSKTNIDANKTNVDSKTNTNIDASKTQPANPANASTQGRGNAGTPENQTKDNDQK